MDDVRSKKFSITVRPACADDIPGIADLLTQLYAVELPGALCGPAKGQQLLMRFTLTAKQMQGLRGRYVACSEAGDVLATGTMDVPNQTPYERAPKGTLRTALRLLGYRATAQLLLTVAQSMIGVLRPHMPDAVCFHSLIVDERFRGQGVGRTLITALEQRAVDHGYEAAWLQVLAVNNPARQFYLQQGYETIAASPSWIKTLTWPSYVMRKQIVLDKVEHR